MRTALFIASALVAGFGLGWMCRPLPVASAEVRARLAPAPTTPRTTPPASADPSVSVRSAPPSREAIRQRLELLRWLRKSGLFSSHHAASGSTFNPSPLTGLGLEPGEIAYLNAALQDAKHAIDAGHVEKATSRPSGDGKKLIVDIPALDASASRAIYDRFRQTLTSALGPERFELFDEITGGTIDLALYQFGLANNRYELELKSRHQSKDGVPVFSYMRWYLDDKGNSSSGEGGMVTLAEIEKREPILGRFIPSHLRTLDGK